jgi:hypothetical protein
VRVLGVYERLAKGGAVISFDQMGPISLRSTRMVRAGPGGRPERRRATFNRRHGTRYGFGARCPRPAQAAPDAPPLLPAPDPHLRIQDNLSANCSTGQALGRWDAKTTGTKWAIEERWPEGEPHQCESHPLQHALERTAGHEGKE